MSFYGKNVVVRGGIAMRKGSAVWRWYVKNWRRIRGLVGKKKRKPSPAPKPAPTPAPKPKPSPAPFTPLEGVDGVSVPSGAQLRAARKRFAGRYVSTSGNPKNLTKREVADLHAHGIGIVLFFETTGVTFEGGRGAGVKDAHLALEQLHGLGAPEKNRNGHPVAVYFTVDADPHGREAQIVSYIHGASSVLGPARTGVYGGLGAVDACYKAHVCRYFCQAYAWSGGLWHKARHLEQYANGQHVAGHSVDLERQVRPDAGLWLP